MLIETAALISFATWLGTKIADKGFDFVYDKLSKDDEINKKFYKCIEEAASKIEKKYPDLLGNSIEFFFKQPDIFEELCKLFFINQDVNIEIISETFHEASLPNDFVLEFINELKSELTKDRELNEILSNKELFITIKGISKEVSELVENSTLNSKEITEIKELLKRRFQNKFNRSNFLDIYKKNLLNNLSNISFIGLGVDPAIRKGKRKELENIFVKPNLKLTSTQYLEAEKKIKNSDDQIISIDEEDMIFTYEQIFSRPYNYVILGNPGAGKSILIKSIICNIIKNNKDSFKNNRILSFIPFRVELKSYSSYKKKHGGNLLKYLTNSLEEEFSTPTILEENLQEIISKEKIIMFFDGLDEIFNLNDKIQIKNDIENFHNMFTNIRSIVTSRFIGYNEAKLNEKDFCELNIMEFDNGQIQEYVTKWYSQEEENEDVRDAETKGFISKMNKIDNELISNPLLLSLIVILFRNNLKIPESKLEIYQSCTNTLVDKWDASKNLQIEIDGQIIQKKEPILADLAFWQYELLATDNNDITYNKAKNIIAESLIKKHVADEYDSMQKAEMFMDYAQKRSIYFDNNFTHKTFLEYYTAYWIYSNVEKKHKIDERNDLLNMHISNSFWFIVLELLFNMIDKDQPDTEIIDEIITNQVKNVSSLPFLIYVIPNVNNISMNTRQLVYGSALNYLSLLYEKIEDETLKDYEDNLVRDIYTRIQRNISNEEQRLILDKTIISLLDKNKTKGFYILINELELGYHEATINCYSKLNETKEYIEILKVEPFIYILEKFNYTIDVNIHIIIKDLKEFCSLFGRDLIFKRHSSIFDQYINFSYLHYYLYYQLKSQNVKSIITNLTDFKNMEIYPIDILEQLLRDKMIFLPDEETITFLCNTIDQIADIKLKTLILFLACYLTNNYNSRFRSKKITIKDLSIDDKFKKLIKKTTKIIDFRNILKLIINDFEITDKEIVELIKSE